MEEADLAAEALVEEALVAEDLVEEDLEEGAEEVSDHMVVVRVEGHLVGRVPGV